MLSTQSRAGQSEGVLKYVDYRIVVASILTIIVIIVLHNRHQFDVQPNQDQVFTEDQKQELPAEDLKQYKSVQVMGKNVKYLEAVPASGSAKVLFLMLHGAKFTAMTWTKETDTLSYLSQQGGHRVVAVDIPGFGQSKDEGIVEQAKRGQFLKSLIKQVANDDEKVLLVTPSMSGDYVLRFLKEGGEGIVGWVPVAPVGLSQWSGPAETALQIQVLAIYGELDPLKKDLSRLQSFFPGDNFQSVIISQGEHPAYLKDPPLFNRKLDDLAKKVQQS